MTIQDTETAIKKLVRSNNLLSNTQWVTIVFLAISLTSAFWKYDTSNKQDLSVIIYKIDGLKHDLRTQRFQDSIISINRRYQDSLIMNEKFKTFTLSIINKMEERLITTDRKLHLLEQALNTNFVKEIKRNGIIYTVPVKK